MDSGPKWDSIGGLDSVLPAVVLTNDGLWAARMTEGRGLHNKYRQYPGVRHVF